MKMHVFKTEEDDSILLASLRGAANYPSDEIGYSLEEVGDLLYFQAIGLSSPSSFICWVGQGEVWVSDEGFKFVAITLVIDRIEAEHFVRNFKNQHGARIAFGHSCASV